MPYDGAAHFAGTMVCIVPSAESDIAMDPATLSSKAQL